MGAAEQLVNTALTYYHCIKVALVNVYTSCRHSATQSFKSWGNYLAPLALNAPPCSPVTFRKFDYTLWCWRANLHWDFSSVREKKSITDSNFNAAEWMGPNEKKEIHLSCRQLQYDCCRQMDGYGLKFGSWTNATTQTMSILYRCFTILQLQSCSRLRYIQCNVFYF